MPAPILQYLDAPYVLPRRSYRNAHSPTNPNGEYEPAYRLSQLVDAVPALTATYTTSGASTEETYGLVVNGAVAKTPGFATDLLSTARSAYTAAALAKLDGTDGTWYPVAASPQDWLRRSVEGFRTVTVDPKTLEIQGLSGSYQTLGGQPQQQVMSLHQGGRSKQLSAGSQIASLELEILQVEIQRSWLDMALFKTRGWYLERQPKGYVSSGSLSSNDGILPLIITGFLVGQAPKASLDLDSTDQAFLQAGGSEPAFLGPFPLESTQGESPLYLIAYLSQLVPFSPQNDHRKSVRAAKALK